MVEFRAFRRCFGFSAIALLITVITAFATPASARSHHGAARHAHGHHAHHAAQRPHHFNRHHGARRYGRHHRRAAAMPAAAQPQFGFAESNAAATQPSSGGGFGVSNIVATARSFIGSGNPTGRSSLWCARFMNMVLQRSGHSGTGSDMARSFAQYGQRISGPQVGAIAVMSRGRRGGHVGVVSGIDSKGNPIVVSGNHGHRVAEATYSRSRVYAYVMPAS
ncbi:TIGR02594 family protein [Rhodopseudomonas rhenobacensis]